MNKSIQLKIDGMHCTSCERLIKEELISLPGVKNIVISLKTGIGSLSFESQKAKEEQIIETINQLGYTAKIINE